jgi:hypothetical protein
MKQEHQQKILAVTKMDSIPFVSAGIASEHEGHVLSEDALIAVAEALEAAEATQEQAERATQLESELVAANDAKLEAQNQLADANATIESLQAEIAQLKEKPAGTGADAAGDGADAGDGAELVDAADMDFQKELYNKI